MAGGARADERVPMIVAMHGMGGEPAGMLPIFRNYARRARIILPFGHPSGGMYQWFVSPRDDVDAETIVRETDRVAGAIVALVASRPTIGRPLVTGFSQGGMVTFALAVTHPELIAAAFPIGGSLPIALFSRSQSTALPPITAFHGTLDLAVPTQNARDSIIELKRAGFAAELIEYPGLAHDISDSEDADILERIARAADALH